jgi:hypothetical protein
MSGLLSVFLVPERQAALLPLLLIFMDSALPAFTLRALVGTDGFAL